MITGIARSLKAYISNYDWTLNPNKSHETASFHNSFIFEVETGASKGRSDLRAASNLGTLKTILVRGTGTSGCL